MDVIAYPEDIIALPWGDGSFAYCSMAEYIRQAEAIKQIVHEVAIKIFWGDATDNSRTV